MSKAEDPENLACIETERSYTPAKQPPAMREFKNPARLSRMVLTGSGPVGNASISHTSCTMWAQQFHGACVACRRHHSIQDTNVLKAVAWVTPHLVCSRVTGTRSIYPSSTFIKPLDLKNLLWVLAGPKSLKGSLLLVFLIDIK